jgi:hypothetical protein
MSFLNIVAFLLLIAGPIVGYRVAARELRPRRWKVLARSAAGGAVGAVLMIGLLLNAELLSYANAGDFLRATLLFVGSWAVFGLVLGVVGLALRTASRRRLVVTVVVMVALLTFVREAMHAAGYGMRDQTASGVVFGPGNVPVVGAAVFVDRGSGPTERLTTDTAGMFRIPRKLFKRGQPALLICAAGAIPFVVGEHKRWIEPERYDIGALSSPAILQPGIRSMGWRRQPIPRECLSGAADSVPSGAGAAISVIPNEEHTP